MRLVLVEQTIHPAYPTRLRGTFGTLFQYILRVKPGRTRTRAGSPAELYTQMITQLTESDHVFHIEFDFLLHHSNLRIIRFKILEFIIIAFKMFNKQSQTDIEIETLVESYKDLQDARTKFKDSLVAIKLQCELPNDKSILVPLTASMYVPGHITNTKEFLLDIGTQYLVEKDAEGSIDYFERKIKFIDVQLAKFSQLLQTRLQAKQNASPAAQTSQTASTSKTGVKSEK